MSRSFQALEESTGPNSKEKFFLGWYTCPFVPPRIWSQSDYCLFHTRGAQILGMDVNSNSWNYLFYGIDRRIAEFLHTCLKIIL